MFSDFSQELRNYETSLIDSYYDSQEEDFLPREEYEEDYANEYWRDWRDEMNIRQAENYI